MNEYTHIAEIYGIRCYFNINTADVKGTTWLNDKLITFFVWFDTIATDGVFFPDGFEIKLIKEL